jgi:hypothetical protein
LPNARAIAAWYLKFIVRYGAFQVARIPRRWNCSVIVPT